VLRAGRLFSRLSWLRLSQNRDAGARRYIMNKQLPFLLAATLAATAYVSGTATTARAQDPLTVNASTIKLKFENERVRVLEATLPAGAKEQMHSHPAYVIYVLEGGRYRNHAPDGQTSEGEFKVGEVIYREPLTHFAENIGDKPMHLLIVELKETASANASAAR
jgi:quercetin dioxygenase-like cupin family protein